MTAAIVVAAIAAYAAVGGFVGRLTYRQVNDPDLDVPVSVVGGLFWPVTVAVKLVAAPAHFGLRAADRLELHLKERAARKRLPAARVHRP